MPLEKDKLAGLSAKQRIKRLKELEEERRKDLDEIENLLKKSEQDLKSDTLAEKITPEQREVDIARLFEDESNEEDIPVQPVTNAASESAPTADYSLTQQMYQDYESLKELLGYELEPDRMNQADMRRLDEIESRIKNATGYLATADQRTELLSASRQALQRVKKYTGN